MALDTYLSSTPNPRLSIVIPVYNGGENFYYCLSSLQKYVSSSVEVIVVADGDTDGSRNLATQFGYQLLLNEISQGPAVARNKGAKIAQGELILFLDADVTVNRNTIDQIINFFAQNPDVDAAIGSYDDSPGALNFLSQYKNLFHHYTHQRGNHHASTFWGACGIIRRDVFNLIGGFSESYRLPCVEDIELGYRLKQAGYSIRLCKDIQVKHLKQWRVISLLRAEIFYRAIPWTVLILKYDQLINDLNLGFNSRFSVVLVYSLLLFGLISFWWQYSILIILVNCLLLLFINLDIYYFFSQKKNIAFSLLVIPWHWFYYFYSGIGFVIGLMISKWRKIRLFLAV